MTQIVIVGCRGYIGSYLYQQMQQSPELYTLTGFDTKLGKDNKGERIDDVSYADVVIYLAGLSGRKTCSGKPTTHTFHENVYDIMSVASKMRPDSLLIYASTASLYEGYGVAEPDETAFFNTQLFDEYVHSMYLREQNVQTLTHIRSVALRLGTVIGISPNQRRDLVHTALLRQAVLSGVVNVFGANQSRAILWTQDLWSVITKLISGRDALVRKHTAYNVASFNCTVAKIANELACLTGCNTLYEPDDETVKYNIGFSMSTRKIETELGIVWQGTNRLIFADLMTDLERVCWSPEYLKPCETIVCRVCKRKDKMHNLFSFGNQPNANHYLVSPDAVLPEYPLQLCLCMNCYHTQIPYTIPPEEMFSNYVYLCGTSQTMRSYFSQFAQKTVAASGKSAGTVLEIACNDGTLLNSYRDLGWKTYGYDPAKNLYEISSKQGHEITVGFWGKDPVPEYPELDMIVAQNVCAHVPDPVAFLANCRDVMSPNTVLYIQTSQANMIELGQFDTAYHEHMSFFTVQSMQIAAQSAGLVLCDVEKVDVHGVSYLFTLRLPSATEPDIRQHSLYQYEQTIGLYSPLLYYKYVEKIKSLKTWMLNETRNFVQQSIPIVGYGSAAKGMTILNYVGNIPLEYIADDSKNKQGYYATNSAYPIVSPDTLGETPGTLAVFVFAWNFIQEIREKIRRIRPNKTTYLVVPYPRKAIFRIGESGDVHTVFDEIDTRYSPDSVHHKTILFSHFYNEETMLTQWIRHHAPMFECAVLINHKSTDRSVDILRREAPSTWNIVDTWLPDFCAANTDAEVAGYENSFNNNHWRLALTTTEFLFAVGFRHKQNTVFDALAGHDAIRIPSVSLIDHAENEKTVPSAALLRQKNSYYFRTDTTIEETEEERYLNNHYNRYMHRIRTMENPYWLGRHNFKHPAITKHMFIVKYLYSPFPEFFARKLQIRGRMAQSNIDQKWGFQHMMDFDQMVEKYRALKDKPNASLPDIHDQIRFFDTYMSQWSGEQLLCGLFYNLYQIRDKTFV